MYEQTGDGSELAAEHGMDPLAAELLGLAPAGRKLNSRELLVGAVRAFAAHPLLYVIVGLGSYLPGGVIDLAYTLNGQVSTNPLGFWSTRIADTIFTSIGFAMLTHLTFDVVEGRDVSLGAYMKPGLSDAFSAFSVQLQSGILIVLSAIPGAILVLIGLSGGGLVAVLLDVLGGVLVFVASVYVYLGYSLALPAYIDSSRSHRKPPSQALRRSWSLVKHRRGRLFLAFAGLNLVLFVVACLGLIPVGVAGVFGETNAATGMGEISATSQVFLTVWGVICQAAWAVGGVLLSTVAYSQLGSRPRGVDVESMVEVFS
ncbi:MAG: hypothetical protein GXP55_07330 [Deltaproteobacteria bacterium]|nr:hypothetical protein [Deltaproteobacteria bacterium]